MTDRRLVLVVIAALVFGACSGGPAATSTPGSGPTATPAATNPPTTPPTTSPTPTVAPPTATPLPSPDAADIAAWAADVCGLNTQFLTDNQQITVDIPEPAGDDYTVENVQAAYGQREPRVGPLFQAALDSLDEVTPYPGGEAFRVALLNEFQVQLDAMPAFFQAVAAATTIDEITTALNSRGPIATSGLLGSARAVSQIELTFADAIAAIPGGCRFFELDAYARVRPEIVLPDFTEVAFEDNFDDDSNFSTGTFDGYIADGALTTTISDEAQVVAKPALYHDARFETNVRIDGFALGGLACRDTGDERYSVVVNPIGLILIYGSDGITVGRRAAPEGFDATNGINLAIECVAGNLDPFTIAVYIDDELVAVVQQEHAHAGEGLGGMYAQSLTAGSSVSFDFFRVLVPAD